MTGNRTNYTRMAMMMMMTICARTNRVYTGWKYVCMRTKEKNWEGTSRELGRGRKSGEFCIELSFRHNATLSIETPNVWTNTSAVRGDERLNDVKSRANKCMCVCVSMPAIAYDFNGDGWWTFEFLAGQSIEFYRILVFISVHIASRSFTKKSEIHFQFTIKSKKLTQKKTKGNRAAPSNSVRAVKLLYVCVRSYRSCMRWWVCVYIGMSLCEAVKFCHSAHTG